MNSDGSTAIKKFAFHALFIFSALRIADAVNVAAGMWFVPKYVSSEDIGAVLPLSSFATFLSLPLFAFAMTAMKESAVLSAAGEKGRLKSLLSGVFLAAGAAVVLGLLAAAFLMPRFMDLIGLRGGGVGFAVVAAAFLGCVAPVYTDALQATKRFKALGMIEIGASAVRFAVMAALMPIKALLGYFSGQAAQPISRIFFSLFALRKELKVKSESYWNKGNFKRFAALFSLILVYQAVPMAVALLEQYVIRTSMSAQDSAGYYMASRFSDFLFYLTFPLLIVSFPYTALAKDGSSRMKYVLTCSVITLSVAFSAAVIYAFFGPGLIGMLPNGVKYLEYSSLMPHLVIITALTSVQVFATNAEVSAGNFRFLKWFIPLHLVYISAFIVFVQLGEIKSLTDILVWLWGIAVARILCAYASNIRVIARDLLGNSRGGARRGGRF